MSLTKHYSMYHLQSAALFSRMSKEMEDQYHGSMAYVDREHKAYVTGSIITSVSFLEATINELFTDAVDGSSRGIKQLDPNAIALLGSMWDIKVKDIRSMFLDKFNIALVLASKSAFDPKEDLYKDTLLVTQLRNALVHYTPGARHFSAELRKRNFQMSRMAKPTDPFFPDQCLSHGCAKWAFETTWNFASEFFLRMGMRSRHEELAEYIDLETG